MARWSKIKIKGKTYSLLADYRNRSRSRHVVSAKEKATRRERNRQLNLLWSRAVRARKAVKMAELRWAKTIMVRDAAEKAQTVGRRGLLTVRKYRRK